MLEQCNDLFRGTRIIYLYCVVACWNRSRFVTVANDMNYESEDNLP